MNVSKNSRGLLISLQIVGLFGLIACGGGGGETPSTKLTIDASNKDAVIKTMVVSPEEIINLLWFVSNITSKKLSLTDANGANCLNSGTYKHSVESNDPDRHTYVFESCGMGTGGNTYIYDGGVTFKTSTNDDWLDMTLDNFNYKSSGYDFILDYSQIIMQAYAGGRRDVNLTGVTREQNKNQRYIGFDHYQLVQYNNGSREVFGSITSGYIGGEMVRLQTEEIVSNIAGKVNITGENSSLEFRVNADKSIDVNINNAGYEHYVNRFSDINITGYIILD